MHGGSASKRDTQVSVCGREKEASIIVRQDSAAKLLKIDRHHAQDAPPDQKGGSKRDALEEMGDRINV